MAKQGASRAAWSLLFRNLAAQSRGAHFSSPEIKAAFISPCDFIPWLFKGWVKWPSFSCCLCCLGIQLRGVERHKISPFLACAQLPSQESWSTDGVSPGLGREQPAAHSTQGPSYPKSYPKLSSSDTQNPCSTAGSAHYICVFWLSHVLCAKTRETEVLNISVIKHKSQFYSLACAIISKKSSSCLLLVHMKDL